MDSARKKKLERAGWSVSSAQEFLSLTQQEAAYIELKISLARKLARRRKSLRLSQVALAKRIKSSQSRVAKMEAGDPSVSIDLLVRSLIALGSSTETIEKAV